MQFVSAPVFAKFTVKIRFCEYWLGYILFFEWAAYNKYLAEHWTIVIINNMAAFLSFTKQMFAMSQQAVSAAFFKTQSSLWKSVVNIGRLRKCKLYCVEPFLNSKKLSWVRSEATENVKWDLANVWLWNCK